MREMLDNCPRCLTRDVIPLVDAEDYHGNPHTSYRCPRCGHVWITRRLAEPDDLVDEFDDPDAWEADDDFTSYDRDVGWL